MGGGEEFGSGAIQNIGGAMDMASTGLLVMGASVPLGMLKNMASSNEEPAKRKKKKSKKGRK
jgi:hypothetical protein